MDPNFVALLLVHLGETTSERDQARAQVLELRRELAEIRTELEELMPKPEVDLEADEEPAP